MGSKAAIALRKGDILQVFCGGGGGYGIPVERSQRAIEDDIAEGFLSPQEAQRVYGRRDAAE